MTAYRLGVLCAAIAGAALIFAGAGSDEVQARATPRAAALVSAAAENADPPEVAIGERLFLEFRFAQFFFAQSGGHANATLGGGDPVVESTVTTGRPLAGPFAGQSMNCRACHLVDEQARTPGGGNRTYADFARRSPVPVRDDGHTVTVRNSPALVEAARPRPAFLLHFDGEFATVEDLVRETLLGRNFGWLPSERAQALAHIAHVIRDDDGLGALAQEFGGPYRAILKGTDPDLPPEFILPVGFRIDVDQASDQQILDAIAALVAAYVKSLAFARDDNGDFSGSPYDAFLAKNGLPRSPATGESDLDYSRRLRGLIEGLAKPRFVGSADGKLRLHKQNFSFGPKELQGLLTFLREPASLPLDTQTLKRGGVGNCLRCHPAPHFTDASLHNTGVAENEYETVHGPGTFASIVVPDLATRNADPETWLPPTAAHPLAHGPFLRVPDRARPGETDLGLWNVAANPALPLPQASINALLCPTACSPNELLSRSVARFKTPGLRDLGHSGPYLHTGQASILKDVVELYAKFSARARAGTMRNPDPALSGMALASFDLEPLALFLRTLNEDYE
jgi:hypothetical protein